MAVELIMSITRSADDRLSGSVGLAGGGEAREFSGILELMRVFEELVPIAPGADELDPQQMSEHGPSSSHLG